MSGLGSSQFRESAIIRNANPEPLEDRAQVTAPREWVVLLGLGLILAALVAWGFLGSVERTLRSDGVLVLSGARRTVLATSPGTVTEIMLPAGRPVAAGRAIVRIAPPGRTTPREDATIESPGSGVVAALLVTPGESIPAGAPVADVVLGAARRLDAVAFVSPQDSWRLAAGMAARVSVDSAVGVRLLPAKLAAVAPRAATPPAWLTRMRPEESLPARGHFLRLAISHSPVPGSDDASWAGLDDGAPCRIEVVLERTSPIRLLIRT